MPTQTYEFAITSASFAVDAEKRIVEGLILPFGELSTNKGGIKFKFRKGSVSFSQDVSRVKLTRDHGRAEGVALELSEKREGLFGRFRVARGPSGDELLSLAEDKVYDGFSVTVDFDASVDATPDRRNEVFTVNRSDLREVALTAMPSFDSARVTRVAASRNQMEDTVPDTDTPVTPENPAPESVQANNPTIPMLELSALGVTDVPEQISLSAGGSTVQFARVQPGEQRQVVNPARPVGTLQVREPKSYRFDRRGNLQPAAHDFGVDLVRAINPAFFDAAARDRVMEFMRVQFNETSTDSDELNPTINLPRYIDEREFMYPIWNAVSRGAPPNGIQPFRWPKFLAVTGYVGDHTEGVEPTPGRYQTTSQTVTPTPLSGKAKITREVWDMGGTPGLGDIIWRRIQREWFENLEAAIVAELNAASPASLGALTAGNADTGQTLVSELTGHLAALQFVRGGFRFDVNFTQADLYLALAGAEDTTGRKLLPQVAPQNADGTAANRWATLDVGGVPFLPAWALAPAGQTAAASSYLLDRLAVDAWATAPNRLTFDQTEVAHVYISAWGYKATAINDINGVREVIWDPVSP